MANRRNSKLVSAAPISQEATALVAEIAPQPWAEFIRTASDSQIQGRLSTELSGLVAEFKGHLTPFCLLSLYDSVDSIDTWESDRIYTALQTANLSHEKNVFLLLLSRGGQIEPAYQISKICRAFARSKFVVAIPRIAKSAATLIALGADEIHMGMLGEMGPIDPQVGDLPALGVKRALQTIASVCEEFPGSAEAFARYMARKLTVEQIGYCERVSESAVQYAQRLLEKRESFSFRAEKIAKQLVYEYKDHGFVIDIEEARNLLEDSFIVTDSPEIQFAEKVHQTLKTVSMYLKAFRKKKLAVVGSLESDIYIRRHD
jgi:hypothetical protein